MTNTYPMICESCDHQFELEMKISEYAKGGHKCPKCEGATRSDFSVKRGVIVDDQSRFRKGNYNGSKDKY